MTQNMAPRKPGFRGVSDEFLVVRPAVREAEQQLLARHPDDVGPDGDALVRQAGGDLLRVRREGAAARQRVAGRRVALVELHRDGVDAVHAGPGQDRGVRITPGVGKARRGKAVLARPPRRARLDDLVAGRPLKNQRRGTTPRARAR